MQWLDVDTQTMPEHVLLLLLLCMTCVVLRVLQMVCLRVC